MPAHPKVYSIPAGAPFLDVLAEAVTTGPFAPDPERAGDPLALADTTILLPTRRAVRALRETLVERLGGKAVILPTIRPIGDTSEEDHLLDPSAETLGDRLVTPPAIDRLQRRLALTELVLAWGRRLREAGGTTAAGDALQIPASAADATRLAADLARLMDDVETAGVDWAAIRGLAPEDHAEYFQVTLEFLKIAFESWPAYLSERGKVDPAARRDLLIRAEAARLERSPPTGPIIAAGSTGTIPATAALLKTIAMLPTGAVVLPGLDGDLDTAGFAAIGGIDTPAQTQGHPQFGLKQLIGALGVTRDDVLPLGSMPAPLVTRARLASQALRPAETTDHWTQFRDTGPEPEAVDDAMAGVGLIVAHNEQEEAVAIALAIREALEAETARVALITPDRALARRVAAELRRWDLAIDDSAGARLDLLPAGVFVRLLAEALVSDGDPVALLSLLKHPLAAFGLSRSDCRRAARILELALFRGRRAHDGWAGLKPSLEAAREEIESGAARHVHRARRRIPADDWDLAAALTETLGIVLGRPAEALKAQDTVSAGEAATVLLEVIDGAVGSPDGDAHWRDAAGSEPATTLLTGLAEASRLSLTPAEVPAFIATLLSDVSVTAPPGADPRIHIWGTLEARLQSADLLILGGLDEGVWPAETRTDPWLSRAMRAEIGLPPPERRIGLAAHDFAQAFAAPKVLVTRAEKRGGTPTVASRWLQRLGALIGTEAETKTRDRGQTYVALARDLDRWDKQPEPVRRPDPKPSVPARPRQLSVTEIETLVRDPYAVYAKHVLRLEPLDPLAMAPDYALRGSLIHDALGRFTEAWDGDFDAAALARLNAIGVDVLAEIDAFPDVQAIWSIRFCAIARWLIDWEARREPEIAERHAEISGELEADAPAGPFALRGRADRIDLRGDGRLAVLDYKTGTPPSARRVLVGFAPQLGLEAAMVRAGAFGPTFAGRSIADLGWIALGQVERGRPLRTAVEEGWTADRVADETLARFMALIAAYDDPERGFVSRARPMFTTRFESPYDHLARVREWALVESEEDLDWLPPLKP
ncbi:double-strand break repair protein AddB [Bauldia sp.]|uniref:double-strand break repair protein AddB n=1 Tax=Bauldia sp. TaxID=2575872 RepID=UPI003BA8F83D